ncbi:hypothetical protein [Rubritalea tangerina]|uniref:hypothetical protein n=1 Tax=Rubritalea tangerina TaxID=430798 RepID=UPI00361D6233
MINSSAMAQAGTVFQTVRRGTCLRRPKASNHPTRLRQTNRSTPRLRYSGKQIVCPSVRNYSTGARFCSWNCLVLVFQRK